MKDRAAQTLQNYMLHKLLKLYKVNKYFTLDDDKIILNNIVFTFNYLFLSVNLQLLIIFKKL